MDKEIPLFKQFPKLKVIPWVSVIKSPTPVEKMNYLSNELGREIWVKRDDLTHEVYGGNKPRKYEFVFADALAKGKKKILTIGSIGTNHGLATTVHAKRFGLKTHLYLIEQKVSPEVLENLKCHHYFGAKLHLMRNSRHRKIATKVKSLFDRRSYFVSMGASSPLGTLGFVNAAFELKEQIENKEIPEPDKLFVTVGSLATCAGLVLGLELAKIKTQVIGIGVTDPSWSSKKHTIELALKAMEIMRTVEPSIPDVSKQLEKRLIVDHSYFGGKYGESTPEGLEAIEIAKHDGLHLEYVYTGKTLSGLIDYVGKGKIAKDDVSLFWSSKSSADLSQYVKQINYKDLPQKFHKFFI